NEVLRCKIHDAPVGAYSGTTIGFYGLYVRGHDNLIDGNEIYNNAGEAIQIYSATAGATVDNNVFRNNIIHDNAFNDGQRNLSLDAIVLATGKNNQAYNNILYHNGYNPSKPGGGIQIGLGCTNCTAYNNTIYGSAGIGLWIDNGPGAQIKNNIVFGN